MRTAPTLALTLLGVALAPFAAGAQDKPVSYHKDIKPLFTAVQVTPLSVLRKTPACGVPA